VSALLHAGHIEATALDQLDTFEGGVMFARAEGIIPAPESNHAVRAAINEAARCKTTGEKKVIVFNLSGHGHFDMSAYDAYFSGRLERQEYSQQELQVALQALPEVPENPGL